MGQAEMSEKEETLSYGLSAHRDGVSIFARRAMRDLVLTSEIFTLPDMTGYLMIPGDYPIAKVKYGYTPVEKRAEGFVEREGLEAVFKPAELVLPQKDNPSKNPETPDGNGNALLDAL